MSRDERDLLLALARFAQWQFAGIPEAEESYAQWKAKLALVARIGDLKEAVEAEEVETGR